MKRKIFLLVVLVTAMVQVNAQSWSDLVSKAKSKVSSTVSSAVSKGKSDASSAVKSATGSATLSDIFNGLIGTATVSSSSIVGTWSYSQPAVAFESSNVLAKAGSKLVANQVQSKLSTVFSQYGIKAGVTTITFNKDNTFTATVKSKKVTGQYKLNGSNILFYRKGSSKALVSANVNLSGSNMQITFKADKLLTFAQYIANAGSKVNLSSSVKTTMSAISTVAKNYSGMQLGLQLEKK